MGPTYNAAREITLSMQIGSKRMPIYPMKSIPEQFTQLRKALGINASTIHNLSLVDRWCHDDKFVIGNAPGKMDRYLNQVR